MEVDYAENEGSSSEDEDTESSSVSEDGDSSGVQPTGIGTLRPRAGARQAALRTPGSCVLLGVRGGERGKGRRLAPGPRQHPDSSWGAACLQAGPCWRGGTGHWPGLAQLRDAARSYSRSDPPWGPPGSECPRLWTRAGNARSLFGRPWKCLLAPDHRFFLFLSFQPFSTWVGCQGRGWLDLCRLLAG